MTTGSTLSAIIQAIKDELSYDPKAQAYYNSLSRRVQRAYEEVLDSEPWLFAQKTAPVSILKTITGSASQRVSATLSTNRRRVQGLGGYTFPRPVLGALFVDQSGTEHRIIGRSGFGNVIFLNSNLTQDIISFADSTNWSIRFDRVLLPADCKEVMGIMDRNTDGLGRIVYVTRRQEEEAWMDKDNVSQPQFYIEDDMLTVSPPTEAPTVTATTGGSLPPRTFEYCYTIFYAGRESAPSPSARVTTTATNNRVQVTSLEDVRYVDGTSTFFESGILRRVYRRDVTNDGAWVLIEAVGSNVTASPFLNDDVLLPVYAGDREGLIPLNIPSVYQTIRPWQTPDADRTWTVRYRYEPPPLVADNAAPILPRPYHNLLTYRVLADLLTGGESAKFERRYLQLFQRCRDSYLDRKESRYPTQSWMRERMGMDYRSWDDRNLSIPSLT